MVCGRPRVTKAHLTTAANYRTFLSENHVTDDGSLSDVQLTLNSFFFLSVLQNSMNLPPDKARLLRQYDNEKKWELICDQVGIDHCLKCRTWWMDRWGRLYACLMFYSSSHCRSLNMISTFINDLRHFLVFIECFLVFTLVSGPFSQVEQQHYKTKYKKTATCCQ